MLQHNCTFISKVYNLFGFWWSVYFFVPANVFCWQARLSTLYDETNCVWLLRCANLLKIFCAIFFLAFAWATGKNSKIKLNLSKLNCAQNDEQIRNRQRKNYTRTHTLINTETSAISGVVRLRIICFIGLCRKCVCFAFNYKWLMNI